MRAEDAAVVGEHVVHLSSAPNPLLVAVIRASDAPVRFQLFAMTTAALHDVFYKSLTSRTSVLIIFYYLLFFKFFLY